MVIKKKDFTGHKRSARVSVSFVAGILFFSLAISTSAVAGEIFWRDDGTGWEYGKDDQGKPTTTIHYRKDPYEWSVHKGGKEVRTYDPKTGGIIHNEFFNDEGVRQWEEVIDPETGDTTQTNYFDLDGNPKVTTQTYNNYWVKEAALKRRGEYKEGWLDQFTKDESTLTEGFGDWIEGIDKDLKGWRDNMIDFLSGGSLGITKKGAQDAPAQPETSEPKRPETGNWDWLPEYDWASTPKSSSDEGTNPPSNEGDRNEDNPPVTTSLIGGVNEPVPESVELEELGEVIMGFSGTEVHISIKGPDGVIRPFHDLESYRATVRKDLEAADTHAGDLRRQMQETQQKISELDNHIYIISTQLGANPDPGLVGAGSGGVEALHYYKDQLEEVRQKYEEARGKADQLRGMYEQAGGKQDKDSKRDGNQKSGRQSNRTSGKSAQRGAVDSSFSDFDALQQGGFGTLNATPTATFDAAPQSRDMNVGAFTEDKPVEADGYKSGPEC